jgi:hypothetical protein
MGLEELHEKIGGIVNYYEGASCTVKSLNLLNDIYKSYHI